MAMTGSPFIRSHEVPKRITGSGCLRVDLDDGQVGLGVVRDQAGDGVLAVGQRDLDVAHAFDDVVVGEDVAAGVDDDAGAHAVDLADGVGRAEARRFRPARSCGRGC